MFLPAKSRQFVAFYFISLYVSFHGTFSFTEQIIRDITVPSYLMTRADLSSGARKIGFGFGIFLIAYNWSSKVINKKSVYHHT